jgi:hypothetical protein
MQPSPAPQGQPTQSDTQRGIDTKLVIALMAFREIEAAYHAGKATKAEYLAASDEVRRLRATPMKSAIDAYFAEVQS